MIELAYTSIASWRYSPTDIGELLQKSRSNNLRDGITGMLLYRGNCILQVLEGDESSVHRLYEKLLQDSRHHSIHLLYDRPLLNRAFGQWAMAFERQAGNEPLGPDVHAITASSFFPPLAASGRGGNLIDCFLSRVR